MAQDSSRPEFWDSRYEKRVTPWDAGGVPATLREWLPRQEPGRVLIPGCGSGYEVAYFAELGWDVLAIDFSKPAVDQARQTLGKYADCVKCADFFQFEPAHEFDLIYERAFLCALPPDLWRAWRDRCHALLQGKGAIVGFFYLADTPNGPPYGTSMSALHRLLDSHFMLGEHRQVKGTTPTFQHHEHWMRWHRHQHDSLR